MSAPKPVPKVGQIWQLGERYFVVTCFWSSDCLRTTMAGVAELERFQLPKGKDKPHASFSQFRPREVRSDTTARWPFSYVKETGPTRWIDAAELPSKGKVVGYYGGRITPSTWICDECGERTGWASYPHFGQMPPGWASIHGPVLCPECTKKREAAAKPPASPG
jgi:hypothetical protein